VPGKIGAPARSLTRCYADPESDTVPEVLTIGVLVLIGVLLTRDTLRLHRWSPTLFRGRPVVFRESRALTRIPQGLPTPHLRTGLFYGAKYQSLGPEELAFTAQTFNAPLLLGRLRVDREPLALTATGRLHWGLWALFIVGFSLMGFPWPALLFVLALGTINYVTEVRAFRRVLQRVTDTVNQAQ
jgi:hypothetical protein